MHIEAVRGSEALLYMERYVDEGTRTYSPFAAASEVTARYQPRSRTASFELVVVGVPRSDVAVFEADPEGAIVEHYLSDEVLFPVHPDTWAMTGDHIEELRALPRRDAIRVAPTASTRTVLALSEDGVLPRHFLKLHCPKRISRFNRRLRRKNIRTSVEVTRDLAAVRDERFAYLPDSLGVVLRDGGNPWGYLVREAKPRPAFEGRLLIPFFSLYAGDLDHAEDRPLLCQMIEQLGADPCSFVVDELMIPVLECWAKVVRERGILLESHAQNVLLEVDRDLRPRRVVHRDFDVWIDSDRRRSTGLDMPFAGASIGVDTAYPREQHYSLVYDHFVARELFEYLLAPLVRLYGANASEVRTRVAEAFHRCFPDAESFFPGETTYYFCSEMLPGNQFRLVNTGQRPLWR